MRGGRRSLAAVGIAVFLANLQVIVVTIAMPAFAAAFPGASTSQTSWIINAYAIVFAATLIPGGRAADRLGSKRVFLVGIAIFVAASAACALAPSLPALIAARGAQAFGGGLLVPASLASLLRMFPAERRGIVVGAWAAMAGLAAAFGPPVGGLLLELGWQWLFLVNVPLGLACAVAVAGAAKETREAGADRADTIGAACIAALVGALVLALLEGPHRGWADPLVIAMLAASALLLVALAARVTSHPTPVLEPAMLRDRELAGASAVALVFSIALGGMLLGVVLLTVSVWRQSAVLAGTELAVGAVFSFAASLQAGRLAPDRCRTVGAFGAALFAAGLVMWHAFVGNAPDYAALLPGLVATGVGAGLSLQAIAMAAVDPLPPARTATGVGVLTTSRQLGMALGVALLAGLVGDPDSGARLMEALSASFLVLAAISAVAGGLWVAVPALVPSPRASASPRG